MKFLYFFLLFASWLPAVAQQSSIHGVVSLHNSETETGKRIFIANAQIEDEFGKAQPSITDGNGNFTLIYVRVPEKTSVSFLVTKPGLEVVNTDALNAVTDQRELVYISMAEPGKIAEYRRQIYKVGKTEAESRLEKKITLLKTELTTQLKSNKKNSNRIQQLEQDILSLGDKRKQVEEQAQELARKYAPINLDDASPVFREAFILFQKGQLDSALLVLTNMNLQNKVKQILIERDKLSSLKVEVTQRDSIQNKRTRDVSEALRFKADLYSTRFEIDSAFKCYELLMQLDSSNYNNVFSYAWFLNWMGRDEQAIYYYKKCREIIKDYEAANPEYYKLFRATIENNLGLLLVCKKDFIEAELSYKYAVEAYGGFLKKGSLQYANYLATAKANMGILYFESGTYDLAEKEYLEAIKLFKQFAKENEHQYEAGMAEVYLSMGKLYTDWGEEAQAESSLQNALDIYMRLSQTSLDNELNVAAVKYELGYLYHQKNDLNKAEAASKGALEIYMRFAKKIPFKYDDRLALVYNNLGLQYQDKEDYIQSEKAFRKALELYSNLNVVSPWKSKSGVRLLHSNLGSLYISMVDYKKAEKELLLALETHKQLANANQGSQFDLAETQNNLGIVYDEMAQYEKSEAAYKETLFIYKNAANTNPLKYQQLVAKVQYNLGVLYSKYFVERAEDAFIEAAELFKKLAIRNPLKYLPEKAYVLHRLGMLYMSKKEFENAKPIYQEIIEIYEGLIEKDSVKYRYHLAIAKNNLGIIAENLKDIKQAEELYLSAFQIRKILAEKDPQAYEQDVAATEINLGVLYDGKKDYEQSERFYYLALDIYLKLSADNPKKFEPLVALTESNLGLIYLRLHNYKLAEEKTLHAILLREKWMKIDSAAFKSKWALSMRNLGRIYSAILDTIKRIPDKISYQEKVCSICYKLYSVYPNDNVRKQEYINSCGDLSWYLLFAHRFKDAELSAAKGVELGGELAWIKLNLAHALLFQGNYEAAFKTYKSLKELKNNDGKSYVTICLEDLDQLEHAGVVHNDVNRLRAELKR